MVEMERAAGEAVHLGPYTLRVLAVHKGEVVFTLDGPGMGEPGGPPPGAGDEEDPFGTEQGQPPPST